MSLFSMENDKTRESFKITEYRKLRRSLPIRNRRSHFSLHFATCPRLVLSIWWSSSSLVLFLPLLFLRDRCLLCILITTNPRPCQNQIPSWTCLALIGSFAYRFECKNISSVDHERHRVVPQLDRTWFGICLSGYHLLSFAFASWSSNSRMIS